jgi:methanethiol S-methyltransferase
MLKAARLGYASACYVTAVATTLWLALWLADVAAPLRTINTGPASPPATAVAVNLGLIALFALQHSGMARPGFKRVWTRVVPPALERSSYVLLSSVALLLLCWQWRPLTATVWEIDQALLRSVLWTLYLAGWGIVAASTLLIDHLHLFGLRQAWSGGHDAHDRPPPLRVRLLYGLVRHPLLLGLIVAFWAAPDMTVGRLLFAATATLYMLGAVPLEERDLARQLGPAYAEYRDRVPMLVPRPRAKPDRTRSAPHEHDAPESA